jgi:hypothetical protein
MRFVFSRNTAISSFIGVIMRALRRRLSSMLIFHLILLDNKLPQRSCIVFFGAVAIRISKFVVSDDFRIPSPHG